VGPQNKLELVPVEIGLKGNDYWELTGPGIQSGDRVVSNPSDELEEGTEVNTEAVEHSKV
jgi:multidrug efflux pump subunit AcrA (membrane-fusion protein)